MKGKLCKGRVSFKGEGPRTSRDVSEQIVLVIVRLVIRFSFCDLGSARPFVEAIQLVRCPMQPICATLRCSIVLYQHSKPKLLQQAPINTRMDLADSTRDEFYD